MQIPSNSSSTTFSGISILKSANEQSKLASDPISKTIDAINQTNTARTAAQPVDVSALTRTGTVTIETQEKWISRNIARRLL